MLGDSYSDLAKDLDFEGFLRVSRKPSLRLHLLHKSRQTSHNYFLFEDAQDIHVFCTDKRQCLVSPCSIFLYETNFVALASNMSDSLVPPFLVGQFLSH